MCTNVDSQGNVDDRHLKNRLQRARHIAACGIISRIIGGASALQNFFPQISHPSTTPSPSLGSTALATSSVLVDSKDLVVGCNSNDTLKMEADTELSS